MSEQETKTMCHQLKKLAYVILIVLLAVPSFSIFAGDAYAAPSQLKYLVTFFEFEDLQHTKSIDELRSTTIDKVQSFYNEVSYGKFKLTADTVPRWIVLPIQVKNLNVFVWNFNPTDMDSIDAAARNALFTQPGINANSYDIVFVIYAGKVWGHARPSRATTYVNEFRETGVFCHELGHVLGLPDLYSYRFATEGKPRWSVARWVGTWDLMSLSYGGLSSWSLMKLGWFDDSQIARVSDIIQGRTFIIDALGNQSGRMYLLQVHVPGTVQDYYVEVRENIGADASDRASLYPEGSYITSHLRYGVLVYLVNPQGDPREGQIRIVDSHPGSYNESARDLLDAAYGVGKAENVALVSKQGDFSVIVLQRLHYSYKVTIGTAAQGDHANEANLALVEAEDAVSRAENETRTIGLELAMERLASAKLAYSQAQFEKSVADAKSAADLAGKATKNLATITTTATTKNIESVSTSATMSTESQSATFPPESSIYVAVIGIFAISVMSVFLVRKARKQKPR